MAFAVSDFNDLKQLLAEHPQWRVELRQLLLGEDFQALPAIVRELAEAQRRTEERLARLEDVVAQLAEAQRRTEESLNLLVQRMDKLEVKVDNLETKVDKLEVKVDNLEAKVDKLEVKVDRIDVNMGKMAVKLARVDGRTLELRYREKAPVYLSPWVRRAEVLSANDVVDLIEDRLTAEELHDVLLSDLLVRGRSRQKPDGPEIWLAVEISAVVDREDVARAVRRADLLRRAGLSAVAVVAGEEATEGAEAEACSRGVAMLRDGSGLLWDEALAVCSKSG